MINKDTGFRMKQAQTQLLIHQPFFGQIALRLKLKETDSLPSGQPNKTMATNGEDLLFNKEFTDSLTNDELKGVIAHEVMHIAMRHHLRIGNRNQKKFNVAGDYAINSVLKKSGFTLPKDVLLNAAFDGMNAEKIYTLLPDQNDNSNENSDGPTGPGNGIGDFFEPDSKQNPGNRPSQKELKEIESNLKNNINQAAVAAKAVGNLPGSINDIIEGLKEPKIPYTEVLRDYVCEIAKNDFSWTKPNLRYASCTNAILPGLYSEEVGNIAFIIDSSGSVGRNEKEQHAAEISSILEEFPGLEIEIIYVDTQVAGKPQKITADDLPVKLEFQGGGGTDFAPGFDWLRENGKDPQAILYFTDGYCNHYPDIHPECETIWLCTEGEKGMDPPFGKVLGLDVG